MKKILLVFAAMVTIVTSCNKQASFQLAPKTIEPIVKKVIVTGYELQKMLSPEEWTGFVSKVTTMYEITDQLPMAKKKGGGHSTAATFAAQSLNYELNNSSGFDFNWNYNFTMTDPTDVIVYNWIRPGDSLSTTSGNVYPLTGGLPFYYPNTLTTSATYNAGNYYYQGCAIRGSMLRDANGILGALWEVNYSTIIDKTGQ